MKKILALLLIFAGAFFLLVYFLQNRGNESVIMPADTFIEEDIEASGKTGGVSFVVVGGDIYRVNDDGSYTFETNYYESGFFEKYYEADGSTLYKKDPNGELRVEVVKHLEEDFETYTTVQDFIVTADDLIEVIERYGNTLALEYLPSPWNVLVLQSPKAPEVSDYVALRKKIEDGESDFLDNRVEPTTEKAHTGKTSIKLFSVPPSKSMITAKASFETEFLHFVKGDDVWFSGWYFLEEGRPQTIMDFESSWLDQHSGIRIAIDSSYRLYVELKAFDKPQWRQVEPFVIFPRGEWVHIKAHFLLDDEDGIVELWQNDVKVLEGRGRTLPLSNSIYDILELGISANPHNETTTLYIDDVSISGNAL